MAILGSSDPEQYDEILRVERHALSHHQIANRKPWQARKATVALLNYAADEGLEVRYLVGTGGANFFGNDVIKAFGRCAEARCRMRMLVWNDDPRSIAPAFADLHARGKLGIRISGTRRRGGDLAHFLLVGDAAYRLEAPHDYFPAETVFTEDKPEISAIIAFSDRKETAFWARTFESLWRVLPDVASADLVAIP